MRWLEYQLFTRSVVVALSAAAAALGSALLVGVWCVWTSCSASEIEVQILSSRLEALDPDTRRKVCAHRANNVPKYRAASKLFGCLEIDVVVDPPDGGPAAVYHPPDRNYHGLTLHFLLSNEGLPAGKLWVDVKDLSEEHWPALLELLSSHVPDDRRGDVMIETGWGDDNVSAAANAFRENGFVFSYYLPTGEAIDCGSESSISCDRFRTQVKWITSLGFSHLSFDARAMDFVRTIKADLPNDMRLLTWSLGRSWPSLDLLRQVDVCLVRFPSPYST